MRGQYICHARPLTVPTSETSIAGLIIPANTVIKLVSVELAGGSITANNEVRLRIRQFTGNTPTLSNTVTPTAADQGNAIASAVTFGDRGAAGTASVWSAAPTTPQAESIDLTRNLYGGVIRWDATLLTVLSLGGASASYYDITGVAGTQATCTLRLVFDE